MEQENELLALLGSLEDFERNFRIGQKLNLFEVVGMIRQEIKHSRFLGFLLTPGAPHGLGDSLLKQLLLAALADVPDPPISKLEVATSDCADAVIYYERDHFDIAVHIASLNLLFVIENKVDASERDQQLADYRITAATRYPGTRFLGAFLTPDGCPGDDESWAKLGYGLLCSELRKAKAVRSPSVDLAASIVIDHYLDLIERHIMVSPAIIEACKRIYARHRTAIELVYQHGQSSILAIAFETFLKTADGLKEAKNSRAYRVNFTAAKWADIPGFDVADELQWSNPCPVQFWFKLVDQTVHLRFEVGPVKGETFDRNGFIEEMRRLLGEKPRKITGTYTRVAKSVGRVNDDLDEDELAEKLTHLWRSMQGARIIELVSQIAPAHIKTAALD